MIIDLILARADGTPYNAHDFYTAVSGYDEVFPEIVEPITRALDCGAETDVKQKLCDYARDYTPAICDYIQSVQWLEDDAPLLNPICEACKRLKNGCDGTTEKQWTGCISRGNVRQLFK